MTETVLTNAELVLDDRVLLGTLVIRDGLIAEIAAGRSAVAGAEDLGGDLLMPGIIDLHTDNLERQVQATRRRALAVPLRLSVA